MGATRLVLLLVDLSFGGTQRQALELARRLDAGRFQVEVWLLAGDDALAPLAHEWHVPVRWLSRRRRVDVRSLTALWRQLRSSPIDAIVLLTAVPNIWGRIVGRLTRLRLIVGSCRGLAPSRQHERWLWPLADHLLCNAQAVKTLLTTRYGVPEERVTIVPNGVDGDFFRPPPQVPVQARQIILSVARLVPDKDPCTLVRAFAGVSLRHPDAELWLVGDGPERGRVEHRVAALGLAGRVRFLPGRADIRPVLQQASLLALSSRRESLPNCALEAMASGLPVVATSVGGLPEVVTPGVNGWLVPPGNADSLASAIGRLLADREMRGRFGLAGRDRALREFSVEAMARQTEDVLERLMTSARRRATVAA